MKSILLLNGPNLNALGTRKPEIYGTKSLKELEFELTGIAKQSGIKLICFQSNSEGLLIDKIYDFASLANSTGIIMNPGALAHYSYALRDAVEAVDLPVIEVHITDIYNREAFRAHSVIAPVAFKTLTGLGLGGYIIALNMLNKNLGGKV
jgi:3-dehydroquinate dehydratase-2